MAEVQRILVVDDEPHLRDAIRGYLELHGYAVLQAADGTEAVDTVRAVRPRAVILDVVMPELDGVAALKEIRSFSDVPVIMLTALGLPTAVVPGPHDSPTLVRQALAARGEGAPPVLLGGTVMTWGEVAIGAISSDRAAAQPYGDEQGAKTPGRQTNTRLLAARLSLHGGVADQGNMTEWPSTDGPLAPRNVDVVVDANTRDGQGQEMVGRVLVVNPGSLRHGRYAVIDLDPH